MVCSIGIAGSSLWGMHRPLPKNKHTFFSDDAQRWKRDCTKEWTPVLLLPSEGGAVYRRSYMVMILLCVSRFSEGTDLWRALLDPTVPGPWRRSAGSGFA